MIGILKCRTTSRDYSVPVPHASGKHVACTGNTQLSGVAIESFLRLYLGVIGADKHVALQRPAGDYDLVPIMTGVDKMTQINHINNISPLFCHSVRFRLAAARPLMRLSSAR